MVWGGLGVKDTVQTQPSYCKLDEQSNYAISIVVVSKLSVTVTGAGDNKLIFAHGFGDSAHAWLFCSLW